MQLYYVIVNQQEVVIVIILLFYIQIICWHSDFTPLWPLLRAFCEHGAVRQVSSHAREQRGPHGSVQGSVAAGRGGGEDRPAASGAGQRRLLPFLRVTGRLRAPHHCRKGEAGKEAWNLWSVSVNLQSEKSFCCSNTSVVLTYCSVLHELLDLKLLPTIGQEEQSSGRFSHLQ